MKYEDRILTRLSPTEMLIYRALQERDMSIDELVDLVYGHREDGGPLTANGCIAVRLSLIRKKTGKQITARRLYHLE